MTILLIFREIKGEKVFSLRGGIWLGNSLDSCPSDELHNIPLLLSSFIGAGQSRVRIRIRPLGSRYGLRIAEVRPCSLLCRLLAVREIGYVHFGLRFIGEIIEVAKFRTTFPVV